MNILKYFIILAFISGCQFPTLGDIFLRPSLEVVYPDPNIYNYDKYKITIENERYVSVWHFKAENSKGLLVVIPGSDANKSRYVLAVDHFAPAGIDVLLMDYEGFGDSPGEANLVNVIDDVGAVLNFAKTLNKPTTIYSVSLGTPLLAYHASVNDYPFKGYIFEGTVILGREAELWLKDNGFNIDILWHAANFWVHPQLPSEYNIIEHMPKIKEPKLFIHSPEDTVTPFAGGKIVFDVANEPKEFWVVRGDHGKMAQENSEEYKEFVIDWINKTYAR